MNAHPYRGRFAPTPSGPLHFGSLVAALGSYLDAKAHAGEWLLRIEDVDPPRVVAGATDAILRGLEAFGFAWDGPPIHQSRNGATYQAALDRLDALGLAYGCQCSRKEIVEIAPLGVDGPVYPGTCRNLGWRGDPAREPAWRFRVPDVRVEFRDRLLGRVACDLERECGDFVLKRADGVFTYQLAVVVDDADEGITHVVRGADLLTSTPRQIALQQAWGYPTPLYLHLPVVLDAEGYKLSKQTLAAPLDEGRPLPALLQAARHLGMAPPSGIGGVSEFWLWASAAWQPAVMPVLRGKKLVKT
jgi:glutamyl-Q tRNA(Asp) synthetase